MRGAGTATGGTPRPGTRCPRRPPAPSLCSLQRRASCLVCPLPPHVLSSQLLVGDADGLSLSPGPSPAFFPDGVPALAPGPGTGPALAQPSHCGGAAPVPWPGGPQVPVVTRLAPPGPRES